MMRRTIGDYGKNERVKVDEETCVLVKNEEKEGV